jgi:hypothetical protein
MAGAGRLDDGGVAFRPPCAGWFRIRVKSCHKAIGCVARTRLVISPTMPRVAFPAIFS